MGKARRQKLQKPRSPAPHKRVGSKATVEDTNNLPFTWSASFLDTKPVGGWGWDLTPKELHELFTFIEQCQALTWGELLSHLTGTGDRHRKHHSQPVRTLVKQAQQRLSEIQEANQLEFDEVFRFRLKGTVRLWGFREGARFYLLWYDRNDQVYPQTRK